MQLAQDISSRMYVKKRRRSGLRRGFLTCIIGEIDKSRCVSYFSTDPKGGGRIYVTLPDGVHQNPFHKPGHKAGQYLLCYG